MSGVKTPSPPELTQVNIKPEITALLLLDFTAQICNTKNRPRCIESVPSAKNFLLKRAQRAFLYNFSPDAAITEHSTDLAPMHGEPVLASAGPDKFWAPTLRKY